MKTLLASAAVAALAIVGAAQPALAAPKAAPAAASGPIGINGIAFANLDAAVANSNAFQAAQQQRPTTYKAQIDQVTARKAAVTAQLQPLVEKFQKDRAANAPPAQLQQEYAAIQQIQDSANQEFQKTLAPVTLSETYVTEQISEKLQTAVQAAMSKNGVTVLLAPQAVLVPGTNNSFDLTPAVIAELNTLIPSATLVPPAGWEPREVRDQRAQAAAQGGRGANNSGDGR
jgi:Skp family chaperone for outer membrane proteins